ncbi:MAG: hypothetical protein IH586_13030, partial [Anaerolineaceae bacterium]|nr:hypothetical protein [Anaerolineaceae bacterium]
YAAVNSLGLLGSRSAILPLIEMKESSWLMRFAIIEALSRLGSVDGLVSVLDHEMEQQMNRNPAFSSLKDPLLGVEYGRMVEIGVLALERTGDIESLVDLAEGNAWEEEDDQVEPYLEDGVEIIEEEDFDYDEDDLEAEEDLTAYVDEVGQLVSIALDRSARAHLVELDHDLLQRLTQVPDLTLIDLSEIEDVDLDEGVEDEEPVLVYDLSGLREAALGELARREGKAE